ncbi:MAG: protein kinase [Elusimicrobiota bacterium]|jgi:tRNA A-37 threonylcarbamoyl transferase component Bud32
MPRALFLALLFGMLPLSEAGASALSYRAETRRAQEALRQGDWETAASASLAAERLSPGEHLAYPLRAIALSMLDRDGEAVAEVSTAIRMHPKASGLHSVHAFVLNRARLFKQAERSVDITIAGRSNSAWAWYQLAYAQAGMGDRQGSIRSLEQAAAFDAQRFGERLERGRSLKGAKQLLAAFEADPALESCYYVFGLRRSWLGRLPLFWLGGGAALLAAAFFLRGWLAGLLTDWALARTGLTPTPRTGGGIMGLPGADPPAADRAPPCLPQGYRIARQIGIGGMGAVFEAEDLALQRRVAVKRMQDEIRDDPAERERFLKEARTVAKLRHPGIVEIHAIVEHEGEVFLVFEYLEGRTLEAALAGGKRLDLREARRLVGQVCPALAYAHGQGVIHRDLKPANIMLLNDGRAKVMDFGIAGGSLDSRTRRSRAEAAIGTPPYMAPETEEGVVRPESDLYSLAVCVYQALAGERPFAGSGAGLLVRKREMRFAPPCGKVPGLPPAMDIFFASALHADPERRPPSAEDFEAGFKMAAGPV